jgi:putative AlgH/UPF0301 family transcriptional regulator
VALPIALLAQAKVYPLTSTAGLTLHNVKAQPATLQGRSGLRVTISDDARQHVQNGAAVEQLAVIAGLATARSRRR